MRERAVGEIKTWPKASGNVTPRRPRRIDKAADYGLALEVSAMERQWGTIEAHNRLVEYCERLRAKIDAGKATPPAEYVDASYNRPPLPERMKPGA